VSDTKCAVDLPPYGRQHSHFALLVAECSAAFSAAEQVKVKFALEQATKAQRVCRGIALLFL
jgi:hypothetical protein